MELLSHAGFDAVGAGEGPEALDAFWRSTRPPDLLVSAPEGPRVDGHHVAVRIRQELPSLPVLWIAPSPEDAPAEAVPADSVLGTPFSDLRLQAVASAMLQTAGA